MGKREIVFLLLFCSLSLLPTESFIEEFYEDLENKRVKVYTFNKEDELNGELKKVPDYVAGMAIPDKGEIYLFKWRMNSYPFGNYNQVMIHELSHVYLYRTLGFRAPRWFDEGVAMRLSKEWDRADNLFLFIGLFEPLFSEYGLEELEEDFKGYEGQKRRAYALSKAFLNFLFKDDRDLKDFIILVKREKSFERAFFVKFNNSPQTLFALWAKNYPIWKPLLTYLTSPITFLLFALILLFIAYFVSRLRARKIRKRWEEEEGQDFIQ